jgi:chromosome condensin MukBEF complex kleisin-like MukF subunit
VQTFLPYPNYIRSVQALDNKRLGKQRVEAMQLINILENKTEGKGWRSHPALKMWIGYTNSLKYYCNCCIDEWIRRGFKNTMVKYDVDHQNEDPWFIGNVEFHRAMRARLIEKNEEFYLPKFPNDKGFNDGKYFWPVNETQTFKII